MFIFSMLYLLLIIYTPLKRISRKTGPFTFRKKCTKKDAPTCAHTQQERLFLYTYLLIAAPNAALENGFL